MPRDAFLMEKIKQQAAMSRTLTSTKDAEYAWYAGGSYEVGKKMATMDWLLKNELIPEKFIPYLLICRSYLDQQRKAFFATIGSTEITKLGLMLGLERDTIKATK